MRIRSQMFDQFVRSFVRSFCLMVPIILYIRTINSYDHLYDSIREIINTINLYDQNLLSIPKIDCTINCTIKCTINCTINWTIDAISVVTKSNVRMYISRPILSDTRSNVRSFVWSLRFLWSQAFISYVLRDLGWPNLKIRWSDRTWPWPYVSRSYHKKMYVFV